MLLDQLKHLVTQDAEMEHALKPKPFQPPPWDETLRTLDGLQYLVGHHYLHMHLVVQEVVRQRMSKADLGRREQAVMFFIENLTGMIYDGYGYRSRPLYFI